MTDTETSMASNSLVFLLGRQILKTPISSHSTAPYQSWFNTTFTVATSMMLCLNLGQRSTICILGWCHVPIRQASVMSRFFLTIVVVIVIVIVVVDVVVIVVVIVIVVIVVGSD